VTAVVLDRWAMFGLAVIGLFIIALVIVALLPPNDRRDVLPPVSRRSLDNLPPADDDGRRP
jgi:hypothetical protein